MIENIELLAFIKDNLALARTIVIKNEDLAILDNTLMYQYQKLTPSSDKSKWRYYLNLNGEYHSTDEIMYVRSLDDNENIEFTKANLELHPATKKAYRLGSYYFSRLVALYPHQMELIQGIINPIPPEESIPAKNYQILRYTKDYVLWNESQLIPKLQKHIDQIVYQSFGTEYKYTDDLMLPLLIAHLYESIFKFLLQCRFENRNTRHAHSFYIWSYLQSKGISPIYKDLLNNKQTMWLFRNINYVLRNLGKKSTFEQLINILLTERNIPISKYDLIQSTENITTDLHSEPLFYSERLNLIETRGLGQTTNKLAVTMLKEIPEALDNEVYYDPYLEETEYDFTFGDLNNFPIKVLDSELVDTTNRKPETIFHVLNSELIYLAGKDLYNINLDIEDPLSGIHQRISVKDAIVLWHHLLNSYNGASCDQIPQFYYKDVLKVVPPTVNEMLAVGSKPFLTEAWCNDALKLYIPQIRMISPSTFYENSLNIFNLKWKHKKMYSRWLSIGYYSRRKNAISTMYESGYMKLTDKESYAEFLEQYDFDFSSYRQEDYFSLMWEIWKKATGWDQFTHITIAQIQEGMIGLMKFLSSYTIQFIHQTKVESGWYEGGLDLFTENPSVLNPNNPDGQPELENDVESSRIPVHHRVVMMKNEEEETLTVDESLYAGTISSELEENGKVYETPKLYDVTLSDTDKDDGFHSSHVMTIDYKLRNFTGKLPYDVEDLIPSGGIRAADHTLKEMIVDSFEGVRTVGPWTAKSISILNNKGLNNAAVADEVDGLEYTKILDTEIITKDSVEYNKYYVGFVPALLDSNLIKLEITAENEETGKELVLRFDYNIETKTNSWIISYSIPSSIVLNTPFEITPTITGLSLGDETIVEEEYVVNKDITDFLQVDNEDGKVTGKFLKQGWPEDLPLTYILRTKNDNEDEKLSRHYYFMTGLVPSDRYYDPLLDKDFEPKIRCNEADIHAITLENFSVAASSHGWEPTAVYLKKDEDGNYPADKVKTDYNGITDFLSPTMSNRKYVDETVNGVVTRTFEWYYAIADYNVSLDMVLELTNSNDGSVVLREFTYTPEVLDHGAECELNILPEEGFKFGIGYSTETTLTVSGISDDIILDSAENPVIIPGQSGNVAIDYSSNGITDNKISSYSVRPYEKLTQDLTWAVKLQGMVQAKNKEYLIILPYSTFTILESDVVSYDDISEADIKFIGWEANTIYAHAIVPTRYAVSTLPNGWEVSGYQLDKPNGQWPEFVGTKLPGLIPSDDVTISDPKLAYGIGNDGGSVIPEGYASWFTIYMLGNRDYLNGEDASIEIPVKVSLKNKYTEKTTTLTLKPENKFTAKEFTVSKDPKQLLAETDNVIKPVWEDLPISGLEGEQVSSDAIFLGTNKYIGSNGYGSETTYSWDAANNIGHVILPEAPISKGNGIRIYNERTYKLTDEKYANSSLDTVIYYPYVDYSSEEIIRVPIPTLEDIDFTDIGNVNFYQGVRSSYVTLFNYARLTELKWSVSSVSLEAFGSENQDDVIITKVNDVDLTSYLYEGNTRANPVNDAPENKEKYNSAYVSFVPAKSGKQTFAMLVKLTTSVVNDIEPITFRHEIEIDVNEHEGEVVYDSSYPDPDWAVGVATHVLTDVEGITDKTISKNIIYATANDEDSKYITAAAKGNSVLKVGLSLAVTVTEKFTDVTPNAIVIEDVIIDGYATTDPRRERYYYGPLPIKEDKVYSLDDITLETIEWEEDVVWEDKRVNESYYDRYVYNIESKGWTVKTVSLVENINWMNNYFEFGTTRIRNAFLININKYNLTTDLAVEAPEGKQFYLPFYGSRKEGSWPTVISVVVYNKHITGGRTKTLTYRKDTNYVDAGIKLNFTNESLIIGKNNSLTGGMENTPSEDLRNGMVLSSDGIALNGSMSSYFTIYKDPYMLNIKSTYVEGSGNGLKLMVYKIYGKMQTGWALGTYTWVRGYRGFQTITEDRITTVVEYPEESAFNFSYLADGLMQGASCSIPYCIDADGDVLSQWNITHDGLTAYGSDNQDDVIITSVEGGEIPANYSHSINDPLGDFPNKPDGTDAYQWKFLKFIPAKTGKQKFELSFTITNKVNSKIESKKYTFVIEADVKENPTTMGIDDRSKNVYWLISDTAKAYTTVNDIPDTVVKDDLVMAIPLADSNGYLTTTITSSSTGVNNSYMNVTITKDFEGKDRDVLIGHTIIRSDYPDTDNRSQIDYIGTITISASNVVSKDNLDGKLINLTPIVTYDEMAVNESYVEKYTYDASNDDFRVTNIRLVSDTSWMNHYFEHGGSTFTNAQLLGTGSDRLEWDRNEKAPAGKYFFMPMFGSRKVGEYEASITITLTNTIYTKNKNLTFKHKFKRKFVDRNIGIRLNFAEQLVVGNSATYQMILDNIPSSDLTPGVISSNTLYKLVGPKAGYFTLNTSKKLVSVDSGYPTKSTDDKDTLGVLVTAAYIYRAVTAGSNVTSETQFRAYRGEFLIEHEDVSEYSEWTTVLTSTTVQDNTVVVKYRLKKGYADFATLPVFKDNGVIGHVNDKEYPVKGSYKRENNGTTILLTITLDEAPPSEFDWSLKGYIYVFTGDDNDIPVRIVNLGHYTE